jgi:RecA-family ATPase
LFEDVERLQPKLIVLDNASRLYEGSENDRTIVTRFMFALERVAAVSGAALLLLQHVSRSGAGDEQADFLQGTSGSTGWRNAARQALYQRRTDPGEVMLKVMKSNSGPDNWKVPMSWNGLTFMPTQDGHESVTPLRDDRDLLRLLDQAASGAQVHATNRRRRFTCNWRKQRRQCRSSQSRSSLAPAVA